MKMPSPIVAGCIAIGVFAAGAAVGHFVSDNSSSNSKASGKPQVLGEVFTNQSSTTTTAAVAAPPTSQAPAPTTTPTTAHPAVVTKTVTVTQCSQTQTTSPPVTSTVVVTNPACGNGTASAGVSAQTFPRSNTANTDYETDATIGVHNGIDKPIQIDTLSIRLYYEDGSTQDVSITEALTDLVQPGATNTYKVAVNTGKRPVHTTGLQSFAFHTAGHPECTGRAA